MAHRTATLYTRITTSDGRKSRRQAMKRRRISPVLRLTGSTIVLALITAGCGEQRKVDLSAEEAAIRRTDANWLAAASARDLNRVLPFWTDDATIVTPGMPPIVGKDAIRKYVSGAFATPGFSITWKTEKVEVSQSGDLAYSTGTDRISLNTPDGKSVTEENRGVAIWKKQVDGSWRVVLDMGSPSAPANAK
jgi:uncharacterized protein (TIGR02246 family)